MRRNAYLRASGQKSDLAVRFGDPHFLYIGNGDRRSGGITLLSEYILLCFGVSLVRMRRNSVNSASGLKPTLTIVFSDHDFL